MIEFSPNSSLENDMLTDTLDARRLLCPMPILRTQRKIKELHAGDILKVICTDPGVLQDMPVWCKMHGHKILSTEEKGMEIIVTIQVEGAS